MSISSSSPNAAAASSRSDSTERAPAPSTSSSQSSSSSSTVSGGTARRQHQSLIFTTPSDIVAQNVAHSSEAASSSSSSTRSSPSSSALPLCIPAQAPADGPTSTPPIRRRSAASRPQSYARSYPLSHALRVSSFGIAAGRPDPQSPHTPKVTVHVDSRPLMPGVFVTEEVRNALWEDIQRRRAGASAAATAPHRAQAPPPIPHTFLASAFSAAPPPIDSFSQDTNFLTPSMAHQSAHSIAHLTSPEQSPSRQVAWGAPKTWADMAARKNGAASATFQGYHGVAQSQSPLGSSAGVDTPSATQSSITSPSNKSAQTYSSNHSAANTSTTSLPLTAGLAPAFVPQYREPEHSYAKMSRTTDLAPLLADSHLRLEAPLTVPRGLINTGNLCFANSILQVLVYCAPFYNLFDLLGKVMPADFGNLTPLIEASIQFLREFRVVPPQYTMATSQGGYPSPSRVDPLAEAQLQSEPFIPEFVYDAMRLNKRFDTMRRGHQEDAEEFLGFFLDTLHEELLSALRRSQPRATGAAVNGAPKVNGIAAHEGSAPSEEGEDAVARDVERPVSPRNEEDVWMEVGQKGKTSFTRTTSTTESPITHIFGGKLRSVLRVPGAKGSVTLEPYQALQLDIAASHVQTVEDAIRNLAAPETVHGVRPSPTAASTVDATKQVYIESMPQILVLHLKRFGYDEVGGTIKNSKEVRYGKTLVVSDEVLSPAVRADRPKYNLFGVVYHHGRFATGGHYTVDVLRQDASAWLHIDDTAYYPVPEEQVHYGVSQASGSDGASASASAPRMQRTHDGHAYLLFYQRESSAPAASEGGQAGQHVLSATFAMRASPHQQQQRYAQGALGPAFVPSVTAPYGVTPFTAAFEERGSGGRASQPSSLRSSPRASGSGGAGADTSKGAAGGGNASRVPANGWKAAPTHKAKGSGGSGSQSPSSSKRAAGTGGSGGNAPASPVKGTKAGASSAASPVPAVKPPVPGAPPPSPAQIKAQKKYAAAMAAKEREGREKSAA